MKIRRIFWGIEEVLVARTIMCALGIFAGMFLTMGSSLASERESAKASTVTIPIQEYLGLIRAGEKPRFVSILGASLAGRYGEKLRLEISGQASSLVEKREFLRFDPQNLNFESCSGDAQVAFEGGSASLLPSSSKFALSCQISFKNWSQAQVTFVQAMGAKAAVEGAEVLILSDDSGDRAVTLSKKSAGDRVAENLPVSAVGRFRLTALPESTRFEYSIEIENPSRNTRPFEINLANGEAPSRVDTTSEFTEEAGKISMKLRPGSNSVRLEGTYGSREFKVPIDGGPHYLLLENHQLLQLTAKSSARRISARDAGMNSRFSGQRAYLLQGGEKTEPVSWETKKLDVLPALGYTVENADYNYFVPSKGRGLVEATLRINNQGQPEIPLPIQGRPLYLEVDGTPQVLASNAAGDLLLQLTPGQRNVYVQYEAPIETRTLFGLPRLRLAKPHAVMSGITTTMSFEDGARLLWAQGLGKVESDLTDVFSWIVFFITLSLALSWTRKRGWPAAKSTAAAFGAACVAALSFPLFLLLLFLGLLGLVARHRAALLARLTGIKWTLRNVIGAIAAMSVAGVLLLGVLAILSATTRLYSTRHAENLVAGVAQKKIQSYDNRRMKGMMQESAGGRGAPEEDVADAFEAEASSPAGEGDYQGLPARVTVPAGARTVAFHRGLLEVDAPVYVFTAYLNPGIEQFVVMLALLFWGFEGWRRRREILSWLRLG